MKPKHIFSIVLIIATLSFAACNKISEDNFNVETPDSTSTIQANNTEIETETETASIIEKTTKSQMEPASPAPAEALQEPTPQPPTESEPEPLNSSPPNEPDIIEPNPFTESYTIAIDPGHQLKGNSTKEPIGPGAKEQKAKVASGTKGVATLVPEYQLTLDVSLKLKDELIERGYNVYMIRETNEVDISNRERAEMATEANADIFVRIHADGSDNSKLSGILTISPTKNNPYVSHLYQKSRALSDDILTSMVTATGSHRRGVMEIDTMSGINWSTIPVTIIEMGFMTNPTEDKLMQTEEYQQKLAIGIADGIDNYFARE
ncbi:MAG: N-acetylmuramoyl-L-alanine amidase [Lachnospiraceae bacterium]|nr:N-acetylmuramoyl-L-alanine amidase [Lachnospiraceae bacterium]